MDLRDAVSGSSAKLSHSFPSPSSFDGVYFGFKKAAQAFFCLLIRGVLANLLVKISKVPPTAIVTTSNKFEHRDIGIQALRLLTYLIRHAPEKSLNTWSNSVLDVVLRDFSGAWRKNLS